MTAAAEVGLRAEAIGVLAVNVLGCLVAGVLVGWCVDRLAPALRAFLLPGVLGGFTTFSGVSVEAARVVADPSASALMILGAAALLAASVLIAVAAAALGVRIGRAAVAR